MEKNSGQVDTDNCGQTPQTTQVQSPEQWVPVSSPSATKPMSPAVKDLNKTATMYAPVGAAADEHSGKPAAPETFMLLPSVQDTQSLNTTVGKTVSSETCGIDKLNIGYAPVDIRGKLLLDLKNTGGWRAALFIFGTTSGWVYVLHWNMQTVTSKIPSRRSEIVLVPTYSSRNLDELDRNLNNAWLWEGHCLRIYEIGILIKSRKEQDCRLFCT